MNCYLWASQVTFLNHQVGQLDFMGHAGSVDNFFFLILHKGKRIHWKKKRVIGLKMEVKMYCMTVYHSMDHQRLILSSVVMCLR